LLGLTAWPALADIHPATRRLLSGWGYRYSVWHLRRFPIIKRNAIVICFLQAARAETTDGIVEMQDKLITSIHNKADKRYEALLRTAEEARSRAVEVLEGIGTLVLTIPFPMENFENTSSLCYRATISPSWSRVAAESTIRGWRQRLVAGPCKSLVRLHPQIFTGSAGENALPVRRGLPAGPCSRVSERAECLWEG
jgi:hypothetical protein